jgi:hypothetical protein
MAKILLFNIIFIAAFFQTHAQIIPLENAHAHNDYEQARPLYDALGHGFTSIEADIHLIDGELYVAHDHPEVLDISKTFKAQYLDPLQKLINENNGKIYPSYAKPLLLLVDIKTEAKPTLLALQNQVQKYSSILAHKNHPKGAVKIVISGNRDFDLVLQNENGLIGLDGRPSDLEKNYSPEIMPLISENYNKIISWNGEGEIHYKELENLEDLIKKTHQQGKRVRLWATPENETVWELLLKAGVDLLNTDDLPRLQAFLLSKQK